MRVLLAAALLAATPAMADWPTPSPAGVVRFQAADTNGDGHVDMAEARAVWPDFSPREMQVYDATPDGGLDLYEFQTVRAAGPVVEPGDNNEGRFDEAKLEFRQLDIDKSGGISPAELLTKYPEAAASFAELDLDGDGILSEAEFTGEAAATR